MAGGINPNYKQGNQDSKRLSDQPWTTWLVNGRATTKYLSFSFSFPFVYSL